MTKQEIIESVVDSAIDRNRGAGQNFYVDYECDGRYGQGEFLSVIDGKRAGMILVVAGAIPLWTELGRFPRRGQKDLYVRREHYRFDWNSDAKDKLVETLADDFLIDPTVSVKDEESADELRKAVERRLAVEENYVGSDFDRKFEPFSCFETDLYLYFAFSYPVLRSEIERIRDVCRKEGKIVKVLMTRGIGGDERELAPFTTDDEIKSICYHYQRYGMQGGLELSISSVSDADEEAFAAWRKQKRLEDVCKLADDLKMKASRVKELLEHFGEELDEDRLDGYSKQFSEANNLFDKIIGALQKERYSYYCDMK